MNVFINGVGGGGGGEREREREWGGEREYWYFTSLVGQLRREH